MMILHVELLGPGGKCLSQAKTQGRPVFIAFSGDGLVVKPTLELETPIAVLAPFEGKLKITPLSSQGILADGELLAMPRVLDQSVNLSLNGNQISWSLDTSSGLRQIKASTIKPNKHLSTLVVMITVVLCLGWYSYWNKSPELAAASSDPASVITRLGRIEIQDLFDRDVPVLDNLPVSEPKVKAPAAPPIKQNPKAPSSSGASKRRKPSKRKPDSLQGGMTQYIEDVNKSANAVNFGTPRPKGIRIQ